MIINYQSMMQLRNYDTRLFTWNYICIAGFHTGFFAWGGNVFSHASTKHVNVGGSGGIPPKKIF